MPSCPSTPCGAAPASPHLPAHCLLLAGPAAAPPKPDCLPPRLPPLPRLLTCLQEREREPLPDYVAPEACAAPVTPSFDPSEGRRDQQGRLVFEGFPDFRPNLTPKQVIQAGSFGGWVPYRWHFVQ
jgi:hypothetical protein